MGELAGFQVAAGQLTQGIGPPLVAGAVVVGVGGAGQRFQGGQQDLAGLGLQQPLDRDHALKGGSPPQPPPLVAPLGLGVGALGVDSRAQMGDDPAQPGRVKPPSRGQQGRFGLGGEVVGQLLGAVGQHLGMGG